MKPFPIIALVAGLQALPLVVVAEADDPAEILARRGKGVVTQDDFAARAAAIPEDIRYGALRDGNRVRDLVNTLLLRSQLAAEARAAGYAEDPIVIDRMRLAAQHELAEAWVQHYMDSQPDADYEALAREEFRLRGENMRTEEAIDVSHILISTEERSDDDARAIADSVYQQLVEDPEKFGQLVLEYSDDPSAAANGGSFKGVKRGELVTAFEEVAFELEPGTISEPVKTAYGYHIIRLDAYIEPQQQTFEDAKPQLVKRAREEHKERIRRDYLSNLTSLNVEMTEEALREMVKRQFGEEVLAPEAGAAKTE
jgi:parvulin-like peptidyl-prolyl isomerase